MTATVLLVFTLFTLCLAGTWMKVGTNPGSTMLQVNNVGSGPFDPKKISNWQFDIRFPLIPARGGGSCNHNIYNANCVQNGETWNIYYGGWDGVSSCHDSVSIVTSADRFQTFSQHFPMIATGAAIHVNNPSAIKVNNSFWLIVTTQLQNNQLNKPAISVATTGIDWNPNQGGVPSANINVNGYPYNWAQADVNGGNVIFFDPSTEIYHFYFIDFKVEPQHSVFHAISKNDLNNFQFVEISLVEPLKVVTDIKHINNSYLMGLHINGPNVYYSVSNSLYGAFPPSSVLFSHSGASDQYIVSVGFIVDEYSQRLLGALYGAGPVPSLDQNEIYGVWLQKRVLFASNSTIWGIGEASRAYGPDTALLLTNSHTLEGKFYTYAEDFVDVNHPGTLLDVSPTVVVTQGDIWQYNP